MVEKLKDLLKRNGFRTAVTNQDVITVDRAVDVVLDWLYSFWEEEPIRAAVVELEKTEHG